MPDGHRRVTLQVTAVDDQFGTHTPLADHNFTRPGGI
jgi:hypothetical protein